MKKDNLIGKVFKVNSEVDFNNKNVVYKGKHLVVKTSSRDAPVIPSNSCVVIIFQDKEGTYIVQEYISLS